MRVAPASDWRDAVDFETPVLLADVVPGEDARCAACGPESAPRPRTELWAYKHRHPNHHHGFVRIYCREHVPAVQTRVTPDARPAARAAARPASRPAVRAERIPTRKSHVDDKVRAMCPECFIEVSATGACGNCGTVVA
ncbi:glucose-6-phosphate dehydrogenase [Microbacterium ulmi]|uniref:Glucose-6-phosphate dehydrogenase n=1 Tax=Microbacterium ulmi TaxID=179095 RepID=A0A7Y2Q020_9MICO|nr:glucose-6-phosphate dehydrogenase [Microbacterium ulmi]NII68909.1 hypothetical protein [Microbacterium ulmi]NNH03893.1 glucose-6-phosphate dehydrogenase [Microbacterium ulmi]